MRNWMVLVPSVMSTLKPEPALVHCAGFTMVTLFMRSKSLSVLSSKATIVVGVGSVAPVLTMAIESAFT